MSTIVHLTKSQKKRTQIINLLGNPNLTRAQIAKAVGVSTKTVQRTAKEIKPDVEEAEQKLAEYQILLQEKLPIQDRVDLYDQIARKAGTNPFAAMKAIQRADDLDGILTAKDALKQPHEETREHRPMFNLPSGTNVIVNITKRADPEPEYIDVTPETSEDEK